MTPTRRRDVIAGSATGVVALFFLWKTLQLPSEGRGSESLDPRTIPLGLLGLIIVLAFIVVLTSGRERDADAETPEGAQEARGESPVASDLARVGTMVALLVVYAVLLEYAGLAISTVAFASAALLLMTGRLRMSLVASLAYAAALYAMFVLLLGVRFDNDLVGLVIGAGR